MSVVRQALGRYGEQVAVDHLELQGMRILERNWRCARGELDVVALDEGCLVVCEVRTRRTRRQDGVALALESVTPRKVQRLRLLTGAWLESAGERFDDLRFDGVRIDVVAVHRPPSGPPHVVHLRAVG